MNIQYMRYFTTIAKLENVSKAAELLHMSQSSLSKNIASLEKELGTQLFDRNGKKLTLNSAGIRFLESCRVILNETDDVTRDLKLMTTGHSNQIRISAAGINYRLFECMSAFKEKYPETEYEVDCMIDNDDLPNINEYDMIIYPNEMKYDKFKGYKFYDEKYFLAINSKSELAGRISAPAKVLEGLDYVFLRYENGQIEYPYGVCAALTVQTGRCNFVSSRELHRQIICSGIAAGFVPEGSADMYRHNGVIRLLPLTDIRFIRPMKVCFKRERHLSELALLFRDYVITYFNLNTEDDHADR